MDNKRGLSSFTSFIVAIIILIPVLFVILIVILAGSSSVKAAVQSPEAYVSETLAALTTGESVIVGGLSPVLQSNQFLAQFYGSTSCIDFLDQLARVGVLLTPTDPSSLNGTYFICIGSYNSQGISSNSYSGWLSLPSQADNASFPNWFPAAGDLNSADSTNTSGTTGSEGTLSYFRNTFSPEATLSGSCNSFFNATTTVGADAPAQYITALNCVTLGEKNNEPIYMSAYANYQPIAFLHGNPGTLDLQTCTYAGGNVLICQFDIA